MHHPQVSLEPTTDTNQ